MKTTIFWLPTRTKGNLSPQPNVASHSPEMHSQLAVNGQHEAVGSLYVKCMSEFLTSNLPFQHRRDAQQLESWKCGSPLLHVTTPMPNMAQINYAEQHTKLRTNSALQKAIICAIVHFLSSSLREQMQNSLRCSRHEKHPVFYYYVTVFCTRSVTELWLLSSAVSVDFVFLKPSSSCLHYSWDVPGTCSVQWHSANRQINILDPVVSFHSAWLPWFTAWVDKVGQTWSASSLTVSWSPWPSKIMNIYTVSSTEFALCATKQFA